MNRSINFARLIHFLLFVVIAQCASAQSFQWLGHLEGPPDYLPDDWEGPPPPGYKSWFSYANGVSNGGTVVGDFVPFSGNNVADAAYRWKEGTFTKLPFTRANFVDENARLIQGENDLKDAQGGFIETQFVKWEINDDLETSVTPATDGPVITLNETMSAFKQANGKWKEAGSFTNFRVRGVSDDGSTFVGVKYPGLPGDPSRRAAVWTATTETLIPLLPGDGVEMEALAVSEDGSIVVGIAEFPPTQINDEERHAAFIWTQGGGVRELADLASEIIENWDPLSDLESATAISNDGSFIAGIGCRDGEFIEPWILELGQTLEVQVTPQVTDNKVTIGDTFDVQITVINRRDAAISNVAISAEDVTKSSGDGDFEIISPPATTGATTLQPNGSVVFTTNVRATKTGSVILRVKVTALDELSSPLSKRATSPNITIGSGGDIWVRTAQEPETDWQGNDVYQEFPNGVQYLEHTIERDSQIFFNVRIENETSGVDTFKIKSSESLGDDWNILYKEAQAGGADVTAAIVSQNGWSTEIASKGFKELLVSVSPGPAVFGQEKHIVLSAFSSANPTDSLDAIELVIKFSEVTIMVDPQYPLVGHKAKVQVIFYNSTGTTLSNVKPDFVVADPDSFNPGAVVELLTPESTPPSIASLADKQKQTFEFEFRMKEEGKVKFKSEVSGTKEGGEAYSSPTGISQTIEVGKVSLDSIDVVQSLPDQPLVAGKYAGIFARISNSSPVKQKLSWQVLREQTGTSIKIQSNVENGPEINPGSEQEFLLPLDDQSDESYKIPLPGNQQWTLKLFGNDASVEDFEGQSLKKTYEKPKETFLSKAYAYATFSNEPQLSVSQSNAKQIVANQDAFFESSLPVRFSNFVEVLPFPFSLKLSELSTDFEKNLTGFSITAAKSAYFTNNKRVIMILPDDPSIWGTKLDGLAPLGYEKVLLLRGTISLPGTVAAHEMIHSLGFVPSQTVDKGHVPEGSQVPLGFKISQASGEILKDTPDLMLGTSSSSRWISTEAYSHALAKLSKKGMDPEVIIISGTIDLSDQVEADPWYKILSDQVTEISDQGAYSITFVDKNDQVLIRHQFDPSFELNAVLSEGATGSAILQTDISGFVFAIPAQAGTRSIRIEKGEQILFERPVSLNAPVISEVSDLDRKILQSGLLEKLSWVVRDEDGDDLETSLDWSHDGGDTWRPLSYELKDFAYDWTVPDISTETGWVRIMATDGVNTAIHREGPFTIIGSEPVVIPNSGGYQLVPVGATLTLDGSGSYATDGRPLTYSWRVIGTPDDSLQDIEDADKAVARWTPNTTGTYRFELEVTDEDGNRTSAIKSVDVTEPGILEVGSLSIRIIPGNRVELRWPANLLAALEESDNLSSVSWLELLENSQVEGEERVLQLPLSDFDRFFRLKNLENN